MSGRMGPGASFFFSNDLAILFWDIFNMSEVDRGLRKGKTWEVFRAHGMGVECWEGVSGVVCSQLCSGHGMLWGAEQLPWRN